MTRAHADKSPDYGAPVPRSELAPTTPGRSSAFRQQRTKDTAPEVELRRALRAIGAVGYRKHVPLPPDNRRTADIAFVGAKVAVDVRGCFWHGCPEHARRGTSNAEWWDEKIGGNVARDADTEARLVEAGWTVVVVWEHDDADEAARRVAGVVAERRGARSTGTACVRMTGR